MRGITRIGLVTLVLVVVAAAAFAAGEAAKPIMMAPDQIKWLPNPTVPGVMTAVTWGDMAKGPHGAFHKFTGGFTAPLHTHSANTHIVVLAGTMSMTGEDGKEMKFPAGSFYTQPNTFKHVTKCLPGADCLIYVDADAAWDLKVVGAK